jgi:hypothetical protein
MTHRLLWVRSNLQNILLICTTKLKKEKSYNVKNTTTDSLLCILVT